MERVRTRVPSPVGPCPAPYPCCRCLRIDPPVRYGTYHRMSSKHLQRYVNEFAGRHNIRDLDTLDQMRDAVAGMVGRRLMWRDLVG